jgi:hypothetical protein
MKRTLSLSAALVAALLLAVGFPSAASAAPPANDDFTAAIAVSPPSTQSVDVAEATLEGGEPGGWCWPLGGSVWYQFQPSEDVVVRISTSASPYFDHTVNAYHQTGTGLGGLSEIGCAYPWSQLTLQLAAGETYYVQAGRASWASGGDLDLTFEVILPPPNDDFADARAVGVFRTPTPWMRLRQASKPTSRPLRADTVSRPEPSGTRSRLRQAARTRRRRRGAALPRSWPSTRGVISFR